MMVDTLFQRDKGLPGIYLPLPLSEKEFQQERFKHGLVLQHGKMELREKKDEFLKQTRASLEGKMQTMEKGLAELKQNIAAIHDLLMKSDGSETSEEGEEEDGSDESETSEESKKEEDPNESKPSEDGKKEDPNE